jgi:hypothetical protein
LESLFSLSLVRLLGDETDTSLDVEFLCRVNILLLVLFVLSVVGVAFIVFVVIIVGVGVGVGVVVVVVLVVSGGAVIGTRRNGFFSALLESDVIIHGGSGLSPDDLIQS